MYWYDNTQSAAPMIVRQPQDIFVSEGDTAQLECVTSTSDNVAYQWQKAVYSMGDSGNGSLTLVYVDTFFGRTANLSFSPVRFGDEGLYRCNVSNFNGTVQSEPATVTGEFYIIISNSYLVSDSH